jgi:carbon monoxide dehydrogenase subunit G
MKPVTVNIDVANPREQVYDFLDVMANHEPFTDHMLVDWEYSGPARGVGSKARVRATLGGTSDVVEIEVVSAQAPETIVERNVGAKGRRIGNGTYRLEKLPDGGTRITFTYDWQQAPLSERLAAPLVRALMRRANERAMRRLAELLASLPARAAAGDPVHVASDGAGSTS